MKTWPWTDVHFFFSFELDRLARPWDALKGYKSWARKTTAENTSNCCMDNKVPIVSAQHTCSHSHLVQADPTLKEGIDRFDQKNTPKPTKNYKTTFIEFHFSNLISTFTHYLWVYVLFVIAIVIGNVMFFPQKTFVTEQVITNYKQTQKLIHLKHDLNQYYCVLNQYIP